jgi:hypothetical protein
LLVQLRQEKLMPNFNTRKTIPKRWYHPEQWQCPGCHSRLKRRHLLWRKQVIFLKGPEEVGSWAYSCPNPSCPEREVLHASTAAERLHLKHRRYSRELIIHVGFRRFWQHRTIYEIHDWLTQDLGLPISKRQVLNVIGDFLSLLRAAQAAKIRKQLVGFNQLVIGLDGMQPEKGNSCLYVVRELQSGLTLLAENLDESSYKSLSTRIFDPLKALAKELGLTWKGVVSDAQKSIRMAVAISLPGTPHQLCQFHCLRTAGSLTFQADRKMKKRLKATLRRPLARLQQRIARLAESDPFRAVLIDYADAIRSTLLEGGVAPFELGGVRLFEALADVGASLTACQKRGHTLSYNA